MDKLPCFYRVSVKALIRDDVGRILLAKEESGLWDILGGGLEHDETPLDCLVREVAEESGLVVIPDLAKLVDFYTVLDQRYGVHQGLVIYDAPIDGNSHFVPSRECIEIRYCYAESALNLRLAPSARRIIESLRDTYE